LAERLKANQTRPVGTIPSPVASPTPLEPGVVKPLLAPKKLDPGAKEFVFKVNAKEFKPSFATPSTHSPSPSRSAVVSPTLGPAPVVEKSVARTGFWEKKTRRTSPRSSFAELNTIQSATTQSAKKDFQTTNEDKFQIAMAYTTSPAWPTPDEDGKPSKGYVTLFTEGKSPPQTPNSGQDDSQSGHNYSRSSSVHPAHATPHAPQSLQPQSAVVSGYPPGQQMYPPMGAVATPYGYMIPQQLPVHPQQGVQTGYPPQLIPGQFQQQQGPPYRFQQGYPSATPSPMMQQTMPAQYPPQQPYPNGQFTQQYPSAQMFQPPYYVPQQNGNFTGHPSPGRGTAAMVYQNPMTMVPQQYYPGTNIHFYKY
jgi:hypothetical protein